MNKKNQITTIRLGFKSLNDLLTFPTDCMLIVLDTLERNDTYYSCLQ